MLPRRDDASLGTTEEGAEQQRMPVAGQGTRRESKGEKKKRVTSCSTLLKYTPVGSRLLNSRDAYCYQLVSLALAALASLFHGKQPDFKSRSSAVLFLAIYSDSCPFYYSSPSK